MLQQVEYFVDAVAGYKTDIVLFPEFFNGPLMAHFNQRNTAEAVRQLAEYTEPLREAILQLAVAYNVNIIAVSMPEYRGGALYNAAYLCRRDGTWDKQSKLHITCLLYTSRCV